MKNKKTKKNIAVIAIFIFIVSIFIIPATSLAGLCENMSKDSSFLKCGNEETSFVNFQGGLKPPSAEGYSAELTQAGTAREFILQVTNFILGFLGLAAVLAIIYGGIIYVTAGGEDDKVTKGKKSVMYSVMGLLIVMSSWAIVNTVIKAPSGTDRGAGVVSQQGAGIKGDSIHGSARNFNLAARQIQTLSKDLISAYENYLETDETIQEFYDLKNVPSFQTSADLLAYLKKKQSILTNIENKSRPLGVLKEITRINRILLQEFTTGTIRAIEAKTNVDAKQWDAGNLLFGLGDAFANIGEALVRGISEWNPPGGATKESRSRQNQAELSSIADNINLDKANEADFKITIDELLLSLNDTISVIAGETLISNNPQKKEVIKEKTAKKETLKAKKLSYILQNPSLKVPQEFQSTNIGINFTKAFKAIKKIQENPNNFEIRNSIKELENLYNSIKDLKFIDAVINASTTEGNAPLTVSFDAVKSLSPNGKTIDPSRITWDLDGDGKIDGESGIAKTFTFDEPGTYRVRVFIKSDNQKEVLDGFSTITINVNPPQSHINLDYIIGGQHFPIMKWKETSRTKVLKKGEITHHSSTGRETREIKKRTLEVNRKTITLTLNEAQAGVTFDASETKNRFYEDNKIKRFSWDFGDNTTLETGKEAKSDSKVTHKYAKAGAYKLSLEVEDDSGITDRKIFTVIVRDTAARIKVKPSQEGNVGDEFIFDGGASKASTGQIARYIWSIQREDKPSPAITKFKNEEEIKYQFDTPGTYRVTLEVEDSSGNPKNNNKDHIIIKITSKPPQAQFLHTIPRNNQPNIIHLDGSKSFDPDGGGLGKKSNKNLSYKWTVNSEKNTYSILAPDTTDKYLQDRSRPIIKFNKKGNYTVGLQIKDESGQESEIYERLIKVEKVLSVDWEKGMKVTANLKEGEARIKFKSKSENASAYEIRYGDGEKDSGEVSSNGSITTTHTYKKSGTYEVTLIVFDDENDETVISRKIFIGDGKTPVAVIRLGKNSSAIPEFTSPRQALTVNRKDLIDFDASESINIDGTGHRLIYKWDFNDGNISTQKQTQRVYKELSPRSPGYYTVKLTVTDKDTQKSNTAFAYIRVKSEEPFFLGLKAIPEQSELTTPVKMKVSAQGAEDPDGEVTQYRWWYYDVADPENLLGLQITTTPNTTINIGTKGKEGDEVSYRFGLEIKDNENFKFTTDDLVDQGAIPAIKVTNGPNKPPKAEFTVDRTNILSGESITFTSSSSDPDGKIAKYIWDVEGDGFYNNKPTKQSTITHLYKKANRQGAKTRLKVIDNNYAESTSSTVTIYVDTNSKPPTAAFKSKQLNGLKVKFENNSLADPMSKVKLESYKWDFDISSTEDSADSDGDGKKDNDVDSKEKEPTFEYKESGIYRVKLTVEDSDGNTDEVVNFVNVKRKVAVKTKTIKKTKIKDPFKARPESQKPSPQKPSAKEKLEARLLTNPAPSPDNKIHLKGEEQNISFDFSGSLGDIIEVYIDKNTYFDSNGNGKNDDDKDYKTTRPGTWTTNFMKKWGRIRIRLTVVDSNGKTNKVEKEVIFDEKQTSTDKKKNPLLGPGGKISGNVFNSFNDISGLWLIVGTLFAIISLTLAKLRK